MNIVYLKMGYRPDCRTWEPGRAEPGPDLQLLGVGQTIKTPDGKKGAC